ncbi:hypothetical protein C8Q80DRAFT_1140315 [Daedaleopsis nitida]|nr:hypothetical protein C8Q80DRAFT_1140315 [Daedaleopsis nitida]
MKCSKGGCSNGTIPVPGTCCATHIFEDQPDFWAQKSRVRDVIEAAGHICIFLPKFHCEINYIEYFWGVYTGCNTAGIVGSTFPDVITAMQL